MSLSEEQLRKMQQADLQDAVPEELADITQIAIDMEKPVSARAEEYLQKVGNPFLVRVGEYVVKIGHSDCPETLDDRMEQYLRKTAKTRH